MPGKYGPHGEFFFFLIQSRQRCRAVRHSALFFDADIRTLLCSADVLEQCALLALRTIAEEGRDGDGCHGPGLGDEWNMGCPKSPMWQSEGEAWSEDESVSSSGSREDNVGNDALHVIGLYGSGDQIFFSCRIGSWQRWHRVVTWPWTCYARK